MRSQKADYGLDAPGWAAILGASGAACLLASAAVPGVAPYLLAPGIIWVFLAFWFLVCSYVLKVRYLRPRVLAAARIEPASAVLDLGAGRGLLAIGAAQAAPEGRVVGIDLFRGWDLSGNTLAAAQANAQCEGVEGRVEFREGDMRQLPFEAGEFDAVVSSSAIHNISKAADRETALSEAFRVLKPGGRLAICDLLGWRYAASLRRLGAHDVQVDWSLLVMWGWSALVTATKPKSG